MEKFAGVPIHALRFWNRARPLRHATLALWGAEQAGKTAVLAALETAVHRAGCAMWAADSQTGQIMQQLRQRRSRQLFPAATPVPQGPAAVGMLRFWLRQPRHKAVVALNLVDVGGRWWTAPDAWDAMAISLATPPAKPYDAILQGCDGLICLIDPTRALRNTQLPQTIGGLPAPLSAHAELQTLLSELGAARIAMPPKIAVCLTQMDRPEHYGHLGREATYYQRLFGAHPVENWVDQAHWRVFGCSAAGVVERGPYLISNTFVDEHGQDALLDPQAPPIGVFGPFQWILGLA